MLPGFVGAALGWLINASIFTPLWYKRNELLPLIATIGVSVMMENAMLAWFGPIPYAFDSPYSNDVMRLGGTFITLQNALIIAVSAATIAVNASSAAASPYGRSTYASAQAASGYPLATIRSAAARASYAVRRSSTVGPRTAQ